MATTRVDTLVLNSNETITVEPSEEPGNIGVIDNGGVAISQGKIVRVASTQLLERKFHARKIIDARDEVILPGLVDPHTHLVFAGSREDEFQRRVSGVQYLDVLRKGGGIIETVNRTRQASEESLLFSAGQRLDVSVTSGSTTVEIKSGYGLAKDAEIKILKVIRRLSRIHPCRIVPTFMGAHAIPPGQDSSEYIKSVMNEMLPEVAQAKLAEFCDVFCERGVFDPRESLRVLSRATRLGLGTKIHSDQLSESGGAEIANKLHTASSDHMVHSRKEEVERMTQTKVIPVLLPASSQSLMTAVWPNAREMCDAGLPVALGTDFSPSNWALSQLTVAALAARELRLKVPEIIRGITVNAARALKLEKKVGSLENGKRADLLTLRIRNHKWIGYTYGEHIVDNVLIEGRQIVEDGRRIT